MTEYVKIPFIHRDNNEIQEVLVPILYRKGVWAAVHDINDDLSIHETLFVVCHLPQKILMTPPGVSFTSDEAINIVRKLANVSEDYGIDCKTQKELANLPQAEEIDDIIREIENNLVILAIIDLTKQ